MAKKKVGKTRRKTRRPQQSSAVSSHQAEAAPTLDRLLLAVRSDPDDLDAALAVAEYYNSNRLEDKVLETLAKFESSELPRTVEQRKRLDRLLVFGYVRDRKFVDAERILFQALKDSPESIDLQYAHAYIKISLSDHKEGLAACEKYQALIEKSSLSSPGMQFTATKSHQSQLLNFKATAYRALSRFEEAVNAFEMSIDADPGNHLPYLNLANQYVQRGDPDNAEKVIQRGLKNCRQAQELRLLLESCRKKTTISACMIVKDEEDMLEDCLKSVRDWVDEIIVVDTGSTDRTIEIAESYGARIFHQPWEGNFSKHRNYSIDQATCEWVFIIDADERMYEADVPQIVRLLNEGKHPFISVNVINVYGEDEEYTTFLPSERFFKRELKLRYKGIVHNQLDVPNDLLALRTSIRIKHYGYGLDPAKMDKKLARSRALLEKQLEENPDNAFARFNLSQILRVDLPSRPEEVAPDIIKHSSRAVELTDPDKTKEKHIHLMCLDQLAWTYFNLNQPEKAIEYCQQALALKPDYLDPMILLGHIYGKMNEFDTALEHYERYLRAQNEYDPANELTNVILFHVDSRVGVYYTMATIYHMTEKFDLACEYYQRTLNLNPGYLEANSRLGRIHGENGRIEEAEQLFRRQFELGPESHEAALGLAAIHLQRSEYKEAEEHYLQALKIKPSDGVALIKLGRLYARTERPDQAAQCFERALPAGAADPIIEKELAAAYFGIGSYDRAAAVYSQLVAGGLEDAEVLNDLGNCYFRQGDLVRAEQTYEKALNCSPPLDITYRNLGIVLARQNRPAEAIEALEKYLAVNPEEQTLWQILAELYVKTGETETAIRLYEKYLTHNPDDPLAIFSLSDVYLLLGHRDSAALGYRRVLQLDPDFKPAQDRLSSLPEPAGKV